MNEPLDSDDDTADLNEAVMESAALPTDPPVPEIGATVWDQSVGSAGSRAPVALETAPENIAEQLVDAGNEEAGREQRLAVDDPGPEA